MTPAELDKIVSGKPLTLPTAVREWYLLAGDWTQGGLNVWIPPQELTTHDGTVWILTDTEGINLWGIRVADLDIEDPPVVSDASAEYGIVCQNFSRFVAAMIVNDAVFGSATEEPVELKPDSVRANLMCHVASCCGEFLADSPLESATVVMFAYPSHGPVLAKSRTPAGRALLQRLRQHA
jgi:hypothetical protein